MGDYIKSRLETLYLSFARILKIFIRYFYEVAIQPKSATEDDRRREFILNSILAGSIVMLVILDIFTLLNSINEGADYQNISFWIFSLVVLLFVLLHYFSRRGYFNLISYGLLLFYYLLITYSVIRWGVSLPANLLGYALIITMSSILISSRFGLLTAGLVAFTLIFLGYYESTDNAIPDWKQRPIRIIDAVQYSVVLFFIMLISWLSNREIERSLIRARKSESLLRKERDLLEIKVIERTEELMKEKIDRISQLYRFAEFGKLSSGIFHDLISPLTSLVLVIRKMKTEVGLKEEASTLIEDAKRSAHRVENMISAVRKQIQEQENEETFVLNDEIDQVAGLLKHKAIEQRVKIITESTEKISMMGNVLKFNQIILNLVSNAIDAYEGSGVVDRYVWIKLYRGDGRIYIWVRDAGKGMAQDIAGRIFEPLFTTKSADKGIGLGLSTTKTIVEEDFGGEISVDTSPDKGSLFKVSFPYEENS